MSYGANLAVENGEDDYREACATEIAIRAATLVAADRMDRADAIKAAVASIQMDSAASSDPTGTIAVENRVARPSKAAPDNQVRAIARDLMTAAREAAEDL